MAKQMEGFIEGTIDDITFYKMGDEYYARMKSSLTRKRFFRDKAFQGSRRSFKRFGKGNQLASLVYNEIAEEERGYETFCLMKKTAIALIKAGFEDESVVDQLRLLKPEKDIEVENTESPETNSVRSYSPLDRNIRSFIKLPGRKQRRKKERLYAVG